MMALFGYSLYLLNGRFFSFLPFGNTVNRDIAAMQSELQNTRTQLAPWKREEVSLLSFNKGKPLFKLRGMDTGIIENIYQEPMLAYAHRRYNNPKLNGLLCVQNSEHLFAYKITDKGITIVVNNQILGVLQQHNGVLYYSNTNKAIAKISDIASGSLVHIAAYGKEIGSIQSPTVAASQVNPRVFMTYQPTTTEEELILQALVFYTLCGK